MTDAGVRAFEMVAALDYERTAGSPQEAQAARSIVSVLHSIGLSPHTQTFEIPLYQITRASFSVTSPASNALFFGVTGYGHSGNTPPEGLEAPFIYIENGEDSLLAQASGCIALLNIHPTPTLYHKMEAANVAGFVSISGAIDDDRRSTDLERRSLRIGRHVTSAEGGIPGLCIRAEDAARLLAAKPKRCKIILQQQTFFGQSANIIADIPAQDIPKKPFFSARITILFLSATVPTTTLPAVQSSWSFAAFLRITPCAVLAALYGAEQKKSDSRAVGIMRVPSVLIHSVKLC